jgi:signal transduction histidine kinase
MTRAWRNSNLWFFFAVVMVFLVIVTVLLLGYYQAREVSEVQQINNTLSNRTQEVANEIETNFVRLQQVAKTTATQLSDISDLATAERVLQRTLQSTSPQQLYGMGIWYQPFAFAPNQEYISRYINRRDFSSYETEFNDYWEQPTAENNQYIYYLQPWYQSGVSGNGNVKFVPPYKDGDYIWQTASIAFYNTDGRLSGVVTADMIVPQLTAVIDRENTDPTIVVFVTNSRGQLLAHPHVNDLIPYAQAQGITVNTILDIPDDVLHAYNTVLFPSGCFEQENAIGYANWLVHICQDISAAMAPLTGLRTSIGALIGVLWVGTLGATTLVYQTVTRNQRIAQEKLALQTEITRQQEMQTVLEHKVQERTAELQKAKDEAELANTAKSAFLASMSHELRTPLNAILNYTDFMSMGMMGAVNDEQVDTLNKVSGSGKHLLSLINDVLDMTKIESGNLKLFIEDNISLADELETVIATAQSFLTDKPDVAFITEIESNLPLLLGDRRRIRQIFLNLVTNAIKFTERGSITLSVKRVGGDILSAVTDTGAGIRAEDLDNVFEAFKQSESGIRSGTGTGLGLPISRRFAEAHGGQLWVQSVVGKGSTFYVRLPILSPKLLQTDPAEVSNAQ